MADQKPNHVFLSYSDENEATVESLARRLRTDARLSFWFRPWHAIPGQDIQTQMENALYDAQSCAVFISSAELDGWQNEQVRAAIQARVEDEPGYRVIPVLLPGTGRLRKRDLPSFLRLYEPVQFQSDDDPRAFKYLLAGILGIPPIDVEGFLQSGAGPAAGEIAATHPEPPAQPPAAPSFEPLHVDPDNPPIRAIRDLLSTTFTARELQTFCQDRPSFRRVVGRFGPGHGLDDMVAEIIDFTGTRLLWDELLAEVAQARPKQYARFEPQLRGEE
ncbi:MAG: toll/interleukin-1 receptor domain-containing protein [Anaerolineae bacterium]|jgi:hypothetical protein